MLLYGKADLAFTFMNSRSAFASSNFSVLFTSRSTIWLYLHTAGSAKESDIGVSSAPGCCTWLIHSGKPSLHSGGAMQVIRLSVRLRIVKYLTIWEILRGFFRFVWGRAALEPFPHTERSDYIKALFRHLKIQRKLRVAEW